MSGAYIDYSMSVIISRALPDVRDGLKPVHRRILYAMSELGLPWNKPYKKSARIVGEVLGKYHPHGDSAVYETMVRMAQPWALRYMLVDGQGNYGSVDGDNAAAMRYTEARLARISDELLADLEKNVVDFQPNFDDSLKEPSVLPAKIPNLLINGSSGIAVGMATNMPPHNLSEVIDGIYAYMDNPDLTIPDLMKHVKGPDFPTGGIIYGYNGIRSAFETGRGKVIIRAVTKIETDPKNGRESIIVTELPYQVNKANLYEKIVELVNDKKIDGISEVRDESDRDGMRMVIDLKRDGNSTIVLNHLYKQTAMQVSFGVNNVCLVKGRPYTLGIKDMIKYYIEHRLDVIVRRTKHDLAEAEKRAHILEGLLKALDIIEEVIAHIRGSKDADGAREGLISKFAFTDMQARAILDMRLQRLTGLERDKIVNEHKELLTKIDYYHQVLADEGLRRQIIRDELKEIKDKYGDKRRTEIIYLTDDTELGMEDFIADDLMVITVSHDGYAKRTPLTEYKAQGRGGMGAKGAGLKNEDFTEIMFVASAHSYLLIFTDSGRVYWLKVYSIPEGAKTAKGRPMQNLINIEKDEHVRAIINVKNLGDQEYVNSHYLVFCTEQGVIKKTLLEQYSRPRSNGINAISINEGDNLLDVKLTNGKMDVLIGIRSGRAIRFPETKVRPMGRTATGVNGVTLDKENDKVVGLVCIERGSADLLVVSERGYGKRSDLDEYRITNRGGKGVRTINVTEKTGVLVSIKDVTDNDDLMIIKKSGVMIRLHVSDLRIMGRATQGVRLIRLGEDDQISAIAKTERDAEVETDTSVLVDPGTLSEEDILDAPLNEAPEEDLGEENDTEA